MYDRIGRIAIGFSIAYLRRRYKRQIRIGLGLGLVLGVAATIGGYLAATRHVPEG